MNWQHRMQDHAGESVVVRIQEKLSKGELTSAIDIIYDVLEPIQKDSMTEAKQVLTSLTQHEMPLAILLSALVATLPWRDVLGDARVELANRTRSAAYLLGGDSRVAEISRFL